MAIKWFNIRSKEVQIAETEPQITAMWASSDHSPNITQGQDFGWRLAPEVVVEMKRIKQSYHTILEIGKLYNRLPEDVGEPEILQFISDRTSLDNAPQAGEGDYTDEYDAEVRRLEREAKEKEAAETVPTTTATTTESLADMEKRVELAERLAAANAAATATTTVAPTTTTTTTAIPTTTTTTTKRQS